MQAICVDCSSLEFRSGLHVPCWTIWLLFIAQLLTFYINSKTWICIAPCREHTSKALRTGMARVLKRSQSVYAYVVRGLRVSQELQIVAKYVVIYYLQFNKLSSFVVIGRGEKNAKSCCNSTNAAWWASEETAVHQQQRVGRWPEGHQWRNVVQDALLDWHWEGDISREVSSSSEELWMCCIGTSQ